LRLAAIAVEVFVAKDQRSGVLARSLLRDPERLRMTEMEVTRGRRG
jgi:hypothetical protein